MSFPKSKFGLRAAVLSIFGLVAMSVTPSASAQCSGTYCTAPTAPVATAFAPRHVTVAPSQHQRVVEVVGASKEWVPAPCATPQNLNSGERVVGCYQAVQRVKVQVVRPVITQVVHPIIPVDVPVCCAPPRPVVNSCCGSNIKHIPSSRYGAALPVSAPVSTPRTSCGFKRGCGW